MSRHDHLTGVNATILQLDKVTAALSLAEQELSDLSALMDLHVAGGVSDGPGNTAANDTEAIAIDVRALLSRLSEVRINLADYLTRI